jgi:hypothetical protein
MAIGDKRRVPSMSSFFLVLGKSLQIPRAKGHKLTLHSEAGSELWSIEVEIEEPESAEALGKGHAPQLNVAPFVSSKTLVAVIEDAGQSGKPLG